MSDITEMMTDWRGEYERVLAQRDELAAALDQIIDPIKFMSLRLSKGEKLNGPAAIALSESPSYLREVARAALAKLKGGE